MPGFCFPIRWPILPSSNSSFLISFLRTVNVGGRREEMDARQAYWRPTYTGNFPISRTTIGVRNLRLNSARFCRTVGDDEPKLWPSLRKPASCYIFLHMPPLSNCNRKIERRALPLRPSLLVLLCVSRSRWRFSFYKADCAAEEPNGGGTSEFVFARGERLETATAFIKVFTKAWDIVLAEELATWCDMTNFLGTYETDFYHSWLLCRQTYIYIHHIKFSKHRGPRIHNTTLHLFVFSP